MKNKANRTGDDETDEILNEMEQEGEALPAFADAPEDTEDEEESEVEEDEEEENSDEEDEDADTADESETADEEDGDEADDESEESEEEEGDEEDADDEDEEEEDESIDPANSSKTPLWKRLKLTKGLLRDAQKQLATYKESNTEAQLDAKVEAFSKEHNVSKEAAKALIEIAASIAAEKAGIDPTLRATIERVVKRDEQQEYWAEQDKAFVRDFRSNVGPLAKRDGKDLVKVQKRLQVLAFQPEHAKKSLVSLYLEQYGEKGPKRRITGEGNRGTHGRVHGVKTEDLQPEDIDSMSDEEFDTFSESAAKSSKLRIVRN